MPDMGAGLTLFTYAKSAATLSLSPLVPNAALVRRVILGPVSAPDIWVIRVNGQEVGRFPIIQRYQMDFLPQTARSINPFNDIFAYCKEILGIELVYPIPEGKTFTISSIGGATADIALEYEEFSPSALNPSMVNYPGGGYYLAPAYGYVAAAQSVAGEIPLDTEVSLDFVPDVFVRGSFPVGWTARMLDLFTNVGGVNTYNGAADHLSRIEYLAARRSGQRLFTRDVNSGIVSIGAEAATGSATSTLDYVVTAAPNPNLKFAFGIPNLDAPIVYRPGYVYEWLLGITGDMTGGADYSLYRQIAIVEYRSV